MNASFKVLPNQSVLALSSDSQSAKAKVIGVVDHIEGKFIKLRDSIRGEKRTLWIPLSWVGSVNDKEVCLTKTEKEIRKSTTSESPFDYLPANHGE